MVSFSKAFISTILLLGGSFFIPRPAGAGDSKVQAPFNVGEVIEKASHHPRVEGDRIVIQDRAYEAEFKEGEAVIKARQGKPGAEDVVIPVRGRPEVRDGKVVYSSWEGEVEFEGREKGLGYRERASLPGQSPLGHTTQQPFDFPKIEGRNPAPFTPSETRISQREWTSTGAFLLDTNMVYVSPPTTQQFSATAFDGRNYLIVWEDYRTGYSHIYGARVTPGGVLKDTAGIPLSPPGRGQYNPTVAFDGVNYLVAWAEESGVNDYNIYGARVTPDGAVLDPNGIAISTAASFQTSPSIAFGRGTFLVVWGDQRTDLDIYGSRVTPAGRVLDPDGIPIATAIRGQWYPSVAFDQRNFLVVWYELHNGSNTEVYGGRVTPDGVVLDTAGIAITNAPGKQEHPKVAFDGSNYFVAWVDSRTEYWDIYGARVTPAGVVLDTGGVVISTAPNYQYLNGLTFDGRNFLAVWLDSRNGAYDIYGARVSPSGNTLDTLGFPISTEKSSQWFPAVAFDGRNYLVAWQDRRFSDYEDIFCARVTPQGAVLDTAGIQISFSAVDQISPAVAFDGRNYLAVWQDGNEWLKSDIYGTRVSPTGVILDPARITISVAPGAQGSPDVAFDGRNYLVVWQVEDTIASGIFGTRVSPEGVVIDPSPILIGADSYYDSNPALAFDGRNFLVVWSVWTGYVTYEDIYGARVSSSGTLLDTIAIPISRIWKKEGYPDVAFDGRNYLVVWQDWQDGVAPDICGARMSPEGVVLDTNRIAIAAGNNYYYSPTVAFDGRNYLVVWHEFRSGSYIRYICGARVNNAGVVLDPNGFPISASQNSKLYPQVAFDGNDYTVVWQDNINGPSYDLYGAKVNPSGVVLDSFAVSLQRGDQTYPSIAHGTGDQFLVTYSGFTDSIYGRPANTIRIWGILSPWPSGTEEKETSLRLGEPINLRVYPNPFREKAWVSANVPGRLKVYDALGRLVREFPKEVAKPGPLVWDGRDERGRRLPGGVYFLRYEHGTGCETRKAVLIR